ncbi:hypothetical protein [uncultured Thiodictyon sp.]|uniref:hypothetical protein n=1 Tax=uncultured Thiodictyon sp. TaxID=1846217 RepID=UPI0025E77E64|nr:hypothetical protein [uncultured Thiodictyon sp.]
MPETVKVLGQTSPAAGVLSGLYEVPGFASCTVSSIVICNRGDVDGSFRVAVAIGGADDSPEQYLYYDQMVEKRATFVATIGITLGSADVLRVQAGTSDVSFNLFGIEVA